MNLRKRKTEDKEKQGIQKVVCKLEWNMAEDAVGIVLIKELWLKWWNKLCTPCYGKKHALGTNKVYNTNKNFLCTDFEMNKVQ